jgi:MoaA/NifB/PqqE/SkfB family radical SAM enzyme
MAHFRRLRIQADVARSLLRSRAARLRSRTHPTMLIVEPTLRCDAGCPACYNRALLNAEGATLDVRAAAGIAASLPDLAVLMLGGGEPTLHPDLPGFVAAFARHTPARYLNLPTNGLRPDGIAAVVDEVCRVFPGEVAVGLSIDGVGPRHDAVRGRAGNFDRLCETYARIVALRGRHPNLHLSANTCISGLNADDMSAVVQWVRGRWPAVEGHSISVVRSPGHESARFDAAGFLRSHGTFLAREAMHRRGYRVGPVGHLARVFWHAYYDEALRHHEGAPRRWRCPALDGAIYVDAFGAVHACELRAPIGRLAADGTGLTGLLDGPRATAERARIRHRECSCDHGCFMQHGAFTDPRNVGLWLRGFVGATREG